MIKIKFLCITCEDSNRQWLGWHGYELRETDFIFFSDAHKHMIEYPNHYISAFFDTKPDKE